MPQMIFVNLPVADLDKSKAFYEAVGAVNNPAFTDETAACMVVTEGSIHVMLLTHAKWADFTTKTIPDARFEDPDGHIWEVMWMDPTAIPAGEPAEAAA